MSVDIIFAQLGRVDWSTGKLNGKGEHGARNNERSHGSGGY